MARSSVLAAFFLTLVIVGRSDVSDDVTLKQVWDGGTLLQLLYSSSGEPLACETTRGHPLEGAVEAANLTEARRHCRAANIRHLRIRRATRHKKHRKAKPKVKKAKDKNHLAKGKKAGWKSAFMTPGTKWCGPSNNAGTYDDLGMSWEADRCCRNHDQCQRYILAMSKGYNNFNFSPFTLSHCSCDRRFRTCLKMSGTTAANIVGKLFFNLVQTKCFVLKPERICVERTWWGKCQKTEMRKLAHIKSNMSY